MPQHRPGPSPRARTLLPLAALFAVLSPGCITPLQRCIERSPKPGDHLTCPTPGWTDRAFDLYLPATWDGRSPLPVVLAFHGGGGNRRGALRVTCPGGDTDSPGCLTHAAAEAGFAVVLPDGTGSRPLRNVRTWNAGGGHDGFNCTSGGACRQGVDDLRYFDDLLQELGETVPVDPKRIHAAGLSNGGAVTHRLACQRGDVLASIAPVGGTNQFAETGGACPAQVPVLQIHGTEDPCWTYEQSSASCIGSEKGVKVGVAQSMEGWRQRNACGPSPSTEALPDLDPGDGTHVEHLRWPDCAAPTELLRIVGGGHTWPRGNPYLSESTVGRVTQDLDGNQAMLEFFRAHPKP